MAHVGSLEIMSGLSLAPSWSKLVFLKPCLVYPWYRLGASWFPWSHVTFLTEVGSFETISSLSLAPFWSKVALLKPCLAYPCHLLGPSWLPWNHVYFMFGTFLAQVGSLETMSSLSLAPCWPKLALLKPCLVYPSHLLGPSWLSQNHVSSILGTFLAQVGFLITMSSLSLAPYWTKLALLKPCLIYPWHLLGQSWLSWSHV